MEKLINILKALSDPNRLRAFMALSEGELCVCQLIEMLDLAPSTVSKHMSILKQAGLVKSRKDSRWVYYQTSNSEKKTAIHRIYQILNDDIKTDPLISNDKARLRKIKTQDLEALCRHQKKK